MTIQAPIPREHGGWAMLLTPAVIAPAAVGLDLLGVLALLGWVSAYCVRGPVEALRGAGATGRAGAVRVDRSVAQLWLLIFAGLAVTLLGPVLIFRPAALAALAFAIFCLVIVQVMADQGQQRSMAAGLLAAAGLMAGAPLYCLAALGRVTDAGWLIAGACFAFFAGSVFRVKVLAREKRSPGFRVASLSFHLAAVAGAAVLAWGGRAPWLLALALAAPGAWAAYGAMKAGEAVSLLVIGKGEQRLTIAFGLLTIAAFRFSL